MRWHQLDISWLKNCSLLMIEYRLRLTARSKNDTHRLSACLSACVTTQRTRTFLRPNFAQKAYACYQSYSITEFCFSEWTGTLFSGRCVRLCEISAARLRVLSAGGCCALGTVWRIVDCARIEYKHPTSIRLVALAGGSQVMLLAAQMWLRLGSC